MRLDKFLKISRLIKRRTIAKEACESGRIKVNDKVSKAGTEIKENDIIEISFANSKLMVRITDVKEHVLKADASNMYEILAD